MAKRKLSACVFSDNATGTLKKALNWHLTGTYWHNATGTLKNRCYFASMFFMTRLVYSCANCALVYRVSQKNEPLFVKYFLGDYKLKIIEILHTVIQVYSFTFT